MLKIKGLVLQGTTLSMLQKTKSMSEEQEQQQEVVKLITPIPATPPSEETLIKKDVELRVFLKGFKNNFTTINKNKSHTKTPNSRYYNEVQALIWSETFEKVYNSNESMFIDAAALGRTENTLYVAAQYAMKWLVEKSHTPEERKRWATTRLAIAIRKNPGKGITIASKLQLMVLKGQGVITLAGRLHIKNISIENLMNDKVVETKQINSTWRAEFMSWVDKAAAGETWVKDGGDYRFSSHDETWLLEVLTSGAVSVQDYQVDVESNKITVMK